MSRRALIDALARDLWRRGLDDTECLSIAEYLVEKGWCLPQAPEPERLVQTSVIPKVQINLASVPQTFFDIEKQVTPTKITTQKAYPYG